MMRGVSLALVLSLPSLCSVHAQSPVYFADAGLKTAVESTLWVSDPTSADMLALTRLYVSSAGIADLAGLEYAENLYDLQLSHNEITSLAPLAGLTNLKTLALNTNAIGSIAPLAGLTQLETLNLHDNHITDISAVSGLTGLKTLILRINQISSISAVSGLVNLETLALDNNQISDVSALSGLSHITYLRLGQNQIGDIAPLGALVELEYLDLQLNRVQSISTLSGLNRLETLILFGNQVADISALAHVTSLGRLSLQGNPLNQDAYDVYIPLIVANNPGIDLDYDAGDFHRVVISSTVGGGVVDPGEGEFACRAGQFLRLEAQADSGFAFLDWTGSYAGVQNPAFLTVDRDYEIQARFVATSDTLYVDDDAAGDPGPGDATRSDAREDGSAAHPFDEIQEGIDVATDSMRIVVRPGTYCENIDLLGKSIELTGIAPDHPNAPAFPVLEGTGAGPVMSFTQGEDPNCIVMGFVVTRGKDPRAGAVLCSGSSPTVAHCLIVGNCVSRVNGGAIYCADSNALFNNCTVVDNGGHAGRSAFQIADSDVAIVNSIVWRNGDTAIRAEGTGEIVVHYSDIEGGWSGTGNIDTDPLFAGRGCWLDPNHPDAKLDLPGCEAIWAADDYHLLSQAGRWDPAMQAWSRDDLTSPCIDMGDPLSSIGEETVPHGGVINMGAYGGTATASRSL